MLLARTFAVVAAGGRGERMGGPKQYMHLAGRPLFLWSLQTLAGCPEVDGVISVGQFYEKAAGGQIIFT